MAVCKKCGKELPAPPGMLDTYTPRGLAWLAVVIVTVGVVAIGLAVGTIETLLESELSYTSRFALMLGFCAIMVLAIVMSATRSLKARRLSHFCPECSATLTAERLSRPEELGAHKVRMKKE
jgi:type VI protein secretion system component VasK